jgi:hypothetical protein
MADSYAIELQVALVAHLLADAGVSALVSARVYDEPPEPVVRPFVRIGDIEPRPVRSDCGNAAGVIFGIEVYSRPNSGRVEATRGAEAVVAALDEATLSVVGFNAVYCRWLTQTVDRDGDGKGYSAIVVFETLLDG